MTEELLNEAKAAAAIGMSVAFLRRGRLAGIVGNRCPAPAHLKLGRTVRYLRADLDAWLRARRIDPVARVEAAASAAPRRDRRRHTTSAA
jgi:predicted DNA-binding transcriptional regulator AlpA